MPTPVPPPTLFPVPISNPHPKSHHSSKGVRPLLESQQVWHTNLRQDQDPPCYIAAEQGIPLLRNRLQRASSWPRGISSGPISSIPLPHTHRSETCLQAVPSLSPPTDCCPTKTHSFAPPQTPEHPPGGQPCPATPADYMRTCFLEARGLFPGFSRFEGLLRSQPFCISTSWIVLDKVWHSLFPDILTCTMTCTMTDTQRLPWS